LRIKKGKLPPQPPIRNLDPPISIPVIPGCAITMNAQSNHNPLREPYVVNVRGELPTKTWPGDELNEKPNYYTKPLNQVLGKRSRIANHIYGTYKKSRL